MPMSANTLEPARLSALADQCLDLAAAVEEWSSTVSMHDLEDRESVALLLEAAVRARELEAVLRRAAHSDVVDTKRADP
jgi:hypothetical protein